MEGLEQYRRRRKSASGSVEDYSFHNGHAVLDEVRRWHNEDLPRSKRAEDCVTPIMWDKLLKYMLADHRSRLAARQVWEFSNFIIQEAQRPSWDPSTSFVPTQLPRSRTIGPSLASQNAASLPHTPPELPANIPEEYMAPESSYGKHETRSHYEGAYPDLQGMKNNPFSGGLAQSPESLVSKSTESPPPATNIGFFAQLPSPTPVNLPAAQAPMSSFCGPIQSLPFRSNTDQHTERDHSNRASQIYLEDERNFRFQRRSRYKPGVTTRHVQPHPWY